MTNLDRGTISQGAVFFKGWLVWPWPPRKATQVISKTLEDGTVRVVCEPSGRLRLIVTDSKGEAIVDRSSPILKFERAILTRFAASWAMPSMCMMAINGHTLLSQDMEPPHTFDVKEAANREPVDYSAQNADAIRKRRDRLYGWQTRPNKIRGDAAYVRSRITEELHKLDDALTAMEGRKAYHLSSVYTILRSLIATGDPLPLLQLYAAFLDHSLIVYTEATPFAGYDDISSFAMSFNISSYATGDFTNPIDLGVWLDSPGGQVGTHKFTHKKLLKSIGDSFSAHIDLDRDVMPILMEETSIQHASLSRTQLENYGSVVGSAVRDVGNMLIALELGH